jgi:hypothetical protein
MPPPSELVDRLETSGRWRSPKGLTDFTTIYSNLDTATKWSRDKFQALRELITPGTRLPPARTPTE